MFTYSFFLISLLSLVHSFHILHPEITPRSFQTSALFSATADNVASMKIREIKAELKEGGVSCTDCFDRESLVARLIEARSKISAGYDACSKKGEADETESDNPACCTPSPEQQQQRSGDSATEIEETETKTCRTTLSDTEGNSSSNFKKSYSRRKTSSFNREAVIKELRSMRVAELRAECGKRNIRWATMIEKGDLVRALVAAREVAANFSSSGALTPSQVGEVTEEELEIELNSGAGAAPLLLDVYATWCGPCKMIAPELANVAAELKDNLRVAKIDSDKFPNRCQQLNVNAFPTLILFGVNGKEIQRFQGALMKSQILSVVEPYLS